MPRAAFFGPRHSESDVYFVKVSAIGLAPCRSQNARRQGQMMTGNMGSGNYQPLDTSKISGRTLD